KYRDGWFAFLEHFPNSSRLPNVTFHGAKALGINMVNVSGLQARLTEGQPNRAGQTSSGPSAVECRAETHDLGKNSCAAHLGVLQIFQHQYTCPLAGHDTIAVPIEGPRCRLGRFILP